MGSLRGVISDFKVVARQLRKSPGFALTAVLMLGFGIGAVTAIFSVVNGVLLRPLPFPDSEHLVTVGDEVNGTNWGKDGQGPVTARELVAYTGDTHSFSSIGGYTSKSYELSGDGDPVQVLGLRATAGVFTTLDVQPLLGRTFTAREDEQKARVALLSYTAWKERFGGDRRILGSKILLDRQPYVVIGVMPRNFEFPLQAGVLHRAELWVPMSFSAEELDPQAGAYWAWQIVARLKPGVTAGEARGDVQRIADQVMATLPPDLANFRVSSKILPLREAVVGDARPLLRMLFLAVTVVLLIACANLAGLLLVQAIRYRREIAVRLALGAPPGVVLRESVAASLILSMGGAVVGIVLAALAVRFGRNALPANLPRISGISIDWTVLGFALLLAVATGLLCGVAPAFASLRTDVMSTIRDGGRTGTSGSSHARLRSVLVVLEIAVALILLTASGLLLRSFEKMSDVDLGFRPDHATTAEYSLPRTQYASQAQVDEFHRLVLERMRQLPGVTAAGLTTVLPAAGRYPTEGFVADGSAHAMDSSVAVPFGVNGDFFRATGIPLLRGRTFSEADDAAGELVVIVNHALAERYWPGEDPLGHRLRLGTRDMNTPWMTVVGEVGDARIESPDHAAAEQFYQPVLQMEKDIGTFASADDLNGNQGYIVVRSVLPPEQMENQLRVAMRSVDPQLALTHVETLQDTVSESEAPRRFNTIIVASFALSAMFLAGLGIYSVMAFTVASRMQEMAIRLALGSQRSGIMRLILRSGTRMAAAGCVLGLAGAAATSALLRSFLFDVSPFDPWIMVGAALAAFLLAFAASAIPARRAASVDPLKALRQE